MLAFACRSAKSSIRLYTNSNFVLKYNLFSIIFMFVPASQQFISAVIAVRRTTMSKRHRDQCTPTGNTPVQASKQSRSVEEDGVLHEVHSRSRKSLFSVWTDDDDLRLASAIFNVSPLIWPTISSRSPVWETIAAGYNSQLADVQNRYEFIVRYTPHCSDRKINFSICFEGQSYTHDDREVCFSCRRTGSFQGKDNIAFLCGNSSRS